MINTNLPFDLASALGDWRRQMRMGGIKSADHLDELENHLREEWETQRRLGLSEEKAFELAVQTLGQIPLLKQEFAKAGKGKKLFRGRQWLVAGILAGSTIPLGVSTLLKYDLSPGWRLLGGANLAVIVLAVLGCRQINRLFPVVADQRARMSIGIGFGLLSLATIGVFMNFILPNIALTEGQLAVVVLWALTLMAALGAVWAGLEKAARRQTKTIHS